MKHLIKYHEMRDFTLDKLSDKEMYEYLFNHVYTQEKLNTMNQIVNDAIEYSDFMELTNKSRDLLLPITSDRRFKLKPRLGIVASRTGGSQKTMFSIFSDDVINNRYNTNTDGLHRYHLKDNFFDLYPRNAEYFFKGRKNVFPSDHGYPFYEYEVDLSVIDDMVSDEITIPMEEVKSILGTTHYTDKRRLITGYLDKIINNFVQHMDIEALVSVRNTYGSYIRDNQYHFQIKIIDQEYTPINIKEDNNI